MCCAGRPCRRYRARSPSAQFAEANATGTLKLLIAGRDEGVKRLVYASSPSVDGNNPTLPKREDMSTEPLSPYAVNELAESICRVFARVFRLPAVALRYFNVFGPRQDPKSQYAAVIPAFISSVLGGESPTVYGDGRGHMISRMCRTL